MKRVIIESPYAGRANGYRWPLSIFAKWWDQRQNIRYLRACLRDSLMRGEAPFASHGLYTQPGVLRDWIPPERTHGIEAGFAWGNVAALRAFYTDRGHSTGMEWGAKRAKAINQTIEYRTIPGWNAKRKKLPKL